MWPGGYAARTRTRSPARKRAAAASAPIVPALARHRAPQLVDRDDAALDQRLRDRVHPALVVAHAVVGLGAERLDVPAQLVDPQQLPVLVGKQHHQRVDALLPLVVGMLVALDRPGRCAAHVVMAPQNRAPPAPGGERSPSASPRCISTLSTQRPNLKPTDGSTPTRVKPHASCTPIEATFPVSPITATICRQPHAAHASIRRSSSRRPTPRPTAAGST